MNELKICDCPDHPTFIPRRRYPDSLTDFTPLFHCSKCDGRSLFAVVTDLTGVLVECAERGEKPGADGDLFRMVGEVFTSTSEDTPHKAALLAALVQAVVAAGSLSGAADDMRRARDRLLDAFKWEIRDLKPGLSVFRRDTVRGGLVYHLPVAGTEGDK